MTTHRLKVDTAYVDHLLSGAKTFEVRRNDRAYMVGDYLLMQEDGDPRVSQDSYGREEGHWREPNDEVNRCSMCRSRRYLRARITYVYAGDPRWTDLAHGYVVLGLDGVGLSLPTRRPVVTDIDLDAIKARMTLCSEPGADVWRDVALRRDIPALVAEVERLCGVVAAYEDDADAALVEKAEAVEAESQIADSIAAERDRYRAEWEEAARHALRWQAEYDTAQQEIERLRSWVDGAKDAAGVLVHERDELRAAQADTDVIYDYCDVVLVDVPVGDGS